ncbi:MAG: hypothetical protein Q9195_002392 [Heterodermia aff. obscurata]
MVHRACFLRYVSTKILKRLEAKKFRGAYDDASKKLLLPLSLGVSSVTLLHVLDRHLQTQKKNSGRVSYNIHVLFIDQSAFTLQREFKNALEQARLRFPTHSFSVVTLDEILDYESPLLEGILMTSQALDGNRALSRPDKLKALLSVLPSATSRLDIVKILRGKLINAFAELHECSFILFGDSTTRLAERTLAETAKGRGGSLPWLTSDSMTSKGLKINYPMRDLLKRELVLYVAITEPSLEPLLVDGDSLDNVPVSSKDTTIDGLMSQYFASVEQNYPSIVANVVRTSDQWL